MSITVLLAIGALLLVGCLSFAVFRLRRRSWHDTERRIHAQQALAEARLRQVTQAALMQMLAAAREGRRHG